MGAFTYGWGAGDALLRGPLESGLEIAPDPGLNTPYSQWTRYEGSYHEIGRFISEVAALPRIVTLHNIRIRPLNTSGDEEQLEFTARAQLDGR